MESIENNIFEIISCAGEAKSNAILALEKIVSRDYQGAADLLKEAKEQHLQAHSYHMDLLSEYAQKDQCHDILLLIHAQEYLFTSEILEIVANTLLQLEQRKEMEG